MSKAILPLKSATLRGSLALLAVAAVTSALSAQIPSLGSQSQVSSEQFFSSSVQPDTPPAVAALHPTTPNFAELMQYGGGGRGRYGRPRYRGSNTNADGSPKYTAYFGAGFTQPIGNTFKYDTVSYGFQAGVGRNFDAHFAMNLEFDWDNFGLTGRTLGNQQNLYDYYIGLYNNNNGYTPSNPNYVAPISGLDGYSHIWSFSIEPTYNLYTGPGLGAYVEGGVGFYHKITTFTVPATGTYCDYYYGCYSYTANTPIDSYTSNAPGFNGGLGLTYKFSRFSNERFYGEIRYVYIDNQQRAGVTVANASPANANVYNDYPANSNRTSYFPVKFGIRF